MINKSETISELAKALCAFQMEMTGVAQNKDNPFHGSKYADLGAIWRAIREPLTQHGLAVIQFPSNADTPDYLVLETILVHSTGEWMSERFTMALIKKTGAGLVPANDPQSVGSAITYMRRYALSAVLGIHTEKDDDANSFTTDPNKKGGKKKTGEDKKQEVTKADPVKAEPEKTEADAMKPELRALHNTEAGLFKAKLMEAETVQALNKAFLGHTHIEAGQDVANAKLLDGLLGSMDDRNGKEKPEWKPIDITRLREYVRSEMMYLHPGHRGNWQNAHLEGAELDAVNSLDVIARAVFSLAEKAETRKAKQ